MPIPKDQFDRGVDKTTYQILQFLSEHPDNAYEPLEIAQALGEWKPGEFTGKQLFLTFAATWLYHNALDDLYRKGMVDKKTIEGKTWYCIHK